MSWRVMSGVVATLSLAGCEVLTPAPLPTVPIPAFTVSSSPPTSNGWAGRSAGKGKVLKCGGEDPEVVFFALMVGAGRDARVEDGVITFTAVFGFPVYEEISFPVRRPASYMDDERCVGPDGMGGLWMSTTPDGNFSFFILPGRSRGVQVNQLLPK